MGLGFLTSFLIAFAFSFAWFTMSLPILVPSETRLDNFCFAASYFSETVSEISLYLSFTVPAISDPFSAIFRLVSVPLSGANKMPHTAPAAAPANTLAKTFPAPIVVILNFNKCCLSNTKIKYIAKKNQCCRKSLFTILSA